MLVLVSFKIQGGMTGKVLSVRCKINDLYLETLSLFQNKNAELEKMLDAPHAATCVEQKYHAKLVRVQKKPRNPQGTHV